VISQKKINESSGIAPSYRTHGEYFTHNDSGDKPRFFRFNSSGDVTAVFNVLGAEAVDWEDMASTKISGRAMVFLGDIGDNISHRKDVVVYRVVEPTGSGKRDIRADAVYRLTYPDGAHNCEALFVTRDGAIWLIIKSPVGDSNVYVVRSPKNGVTNMLTFVKTIKTDTRGLGGRLVTGADVSPDEKFVVLRTYTGALEFSVGRRFEDWVDAKPSFIALAQERQGEAICYSLDKKSLLTSSEGSPCKVSILSLSKTKSTVKVPGEPK